MPCFICQTRQTDPERGPSGWKRLVRAGEQVLICPECARKPGCDAAADRCPSCGATSLSKSLDVVRCRDCGSTSATAAPSAEGRSSQPDLSAEIAQAVDRVLGRGHRPGA